LTTSVSEFMAPSDCRDIDLWVGRELAGCALRLGLADWIIELHRRTLTEDGEAFSSMPPPGLATSRRRGTIQPSKSERPEDRLPRSSTSPDR
jgi:hypothetical protein